MAFDLQYVGVGTLLTRLETNDRVIRHDDMFPALVTAKKNNEEYSVSWCGEHLQEYSTVCVSRLKCSLQPRAANGLAVTRRGCSLFHSKRAGCLQ